MSANKFPGFCRTCNRQVGAGHGELTRSASGAWVVECSRAAVKRLPPPVAAKRMADQARTAGVCADSEGVARVTRRDSGKDATVLVGETYRLGAKSGGPLAGQVVTVVGAACHYESAEWNEDCGDMQGAGWRATLWIRAATAEESAPILAAEATRAKALADKGAAEKAVAANYETAKIAATQGLVRTDCAPAAWDRVLAQSLATGQGDARGLYAPTIDRVVDEQGRVWVREDASVNDWDRIAWFGSPDAVAESRVRWAQRSGITRAKAQDYLTRYAGCSGHEDYTALLDLLDDAHDATVQAAAIVEVRVRELAEECRVDAGMDRRWEDEQFRAARVRRDESDRVVRARERARAALSDAQLEALHAIEAAGALGVSVVSSAAKATAIEAQVSASAEVRDLERALAVDPSDASAKARLDLAQARRGGRLVVARSVTIDALVRAGLIRVDGTHAVAIDGGLAVAS